MFALAALKMIWSDSYTTSKYVVTLEGLNGFLYVTYATETYYCRMIIGHSNKNFKIHVPMTVIYNILSLSTKTDGSIVADVVNNKYIIRVSTQQFGTLTFTLPTMEADEENQGIGNPVSNIALPLNKEFLSLLKTASSFVSKNKTDWTYYITVQQQNDKLRFLSYNAYLGFYFDLPASLVQNTPPFMLTPKFHLLLNAFMKENMSDLNITIHERGWVINFNDAFYLRFHSLAFPYPNAFAIVDLQTTKKLTLFPGLLPHLVTLLNAAKFKKNDYVYLKDKFKIISQDQDWDFVLEFDLANPIDEEIKVPYFAVSTVAKYTDTLNISMSNAVVRLEGVYDQYNFSVFFHKDAFLGA